MFSEYIVYFVLTIWLGFVGEYFKDISTIIYAIIVALTLVAVKLYWTILCGTGFQLKIDEFGFYFAGLLFCSGIFWLQKYLRRNKTKA